MGQCGAAELVQVAPPEALEIRVDYQAHDLPLNAGATEVALRR